MDKSKLYEAVLKGKFKDAVVETENLLAAGADPQGIINNELIPAMGEIGDLFEAGKAFIPEMLLSAKAMKSSLEKIKPHLAPGSGSSTGKVVIGTVKGDLHDIGKNLVASMLEGAGFDVLNLGIDIPAEQFVKAVIDNKADILCLSALLTTTMTQMEVIIKACTEAGIRDNVKIMIGGAPVTEQFAKQIGADAYTDSAPGAAESAKRLVGKI